MRLVGKYGKRGVVTHCADRFGAVGCHGQDDFLDIFFGETERAQHTVVVVHAVGYFASAFQFVQFDAVVGEPSAVGLGFGKLLFQFAVIVYLAFFGVYQEYLAGLETAFLFDVARFEVHYADFTCHHHDVVVCNEVACGTQAVAVQHTARIASVTEE